MSSAHKILILCVAVQCLQVNTSPIFQGISFQRSFELNFKPWIKEPIQFIKEKWSPFGHFGKKVILQKRSLDDMIPPKPRPAAPVFEAIQEEPIGTGPLHIVAKAPVYTSLPKVPPPMIPLPKPMPIIVKDYPPPTPIIPPISSNMVIIQPASNSDVSSNTLYTDISRVQSIENYIRSYEISPKPPIPPPPVEVQPIVSSLPPTPIPAKPEVVITPVPPAPVENLSTGIVSESPPPIGGIPIGPVAPPPKPLLPPPPIPPPPVISPLPPPLPPPPPPLSPPPPPPLPPPPPPPEVPLPPASTPIPPPPPPPPAPLPPPPPPIVEPSPVPIVPEVPPPIKPEVPEAPAPILPVPIKEEPKEKPPPPQEGPKTEVVVKENTLVKGSKIALQFGSVFLTLMAQFFDRARATIELMTNPPPKFAE